MKRIVNVNQIKFYIGMYNFFYEGNARKINFIEKNKILKKTKFYFQEIT